MGLAVRPRTLGPCKEGLVAGAAGSCRGGLDMGTDAGMEAPSCCARSPFGALPGCVAGEGGLSCWRHRDDASRGCIGLHLVND
jgi:hypothetical protein